MCKILFTEISNANISSDYFSKENFSINISSKTDRENFEALIKTYIYQLIVNKGIEFLNNMNSTTEDFFTVKKFVEIFNKIPVNNININVNKNKNIIFDLNEKISNFHKEGKLQFFNETKNTMIPLKIKKSGKTQIFLNKKIPRNKSIEIIDSTTNSSANQSINDNTNNSVLSNKTNQGIFQNNNIWENNNTNIKKMQNKNNSSKDKLSTIYYSSKEPNNENYNIFQQFNLKDSYNSQNQKEIHEIIIKQNLIINNLLGNDYNNNINNNIPIINNNNQIVHYISLSS